jgi:hypothetical protein
MVDGVNEVLSAKVADRLIVLIDPAGLLVDLGVAAIAEAA